MLLTVMLVLQPAFAHAQGLVSASPRTQVDVTPSGIPLVNLARPDAQERTYNKFTDYEADPRNLVLNNSSKMGMSVLEKGYIGHNPNYSEGHPGASLIIIDVVGSSRSNLEGLTEVFGRSADVVIANPNGITCRGCGFINTPRVTLGAGSAVLGLTVPSWGWMYKRRCHGHRGGRCPSARHL